MARAVNAAKTKGTAWESRVAQWFRDNGWIHAERRALSGARDRGDIAGVVGVVIEAKSVSRIDLHTILDEVRQEVWHERDIIGAAIIKRRGTTDPDRAYVLMDGRTLVQLLKDAGY